MQREEGRQGVSYKVWDMRGSVKHAWLVEEEAAVKHQQGNSIIRAPATCPHSPTGHPPPPPFLTSSSLSSTVVTFRKRCRLLGAAPPAALLPPPLLPPWAARPMPDMPRSSWSMRMRLGSGRCTAVATTGGGGQRGGHGSY